MTAWLRLRLTLSFWLFSSCRNNLFKINKGDGFIVLYLCTQGMVGLPMMETHFSSRMEKLKKLGVAKMQTFHPPDCILKCNCGFSINLCGDIFHNIT